MASFTIREFAKSDVEPMGNIILQLTKNITCPEIFPYRLESLIVAPNFQYFVADASGAAVGGAGLGWYPIPSKGATAWLEEVVVDEPFRNQGIGTALTEAVVRSAIARGIPQIRLIASNPVAIGVYEKCGFEVEPNQKVMRKKLT